MNKAHDDIILPLTGRSVRKVAYADWYVRRYADPAVRQQPVAGGAFRYAV